ncbi:MAG: acylphosphatase [Spirochaetia bacterium]|jgi:acylphosphatase
MGQPEKAGFRAVVIGRVQGVGFRYSAVREARELDVSGTVANLPDGSVAVFAEGDAVKLQRFLAWLRKGPPGAYVRDVQVEWVAFTGAHARFDVEF